jgi:DNA (cytosine-5)-methyltransferase 1
LWFVGELADTKIGRSGTRRADDATRLQVPSWGSGSGESSRLGNNNNTGLEGLGRGHQTESGRHGAVRPVAETGEFGGVADTSGGRISQEGWRPNGRVGQAGIGEEPGLPGPTNGRWQDADWLHCRDGKWRAVEPGTFPLAHGATARVGRLRAYGNAVCAQVAEEFIAAYLSVRP